MTQADWGRLNGLVARGIDTPRSLLTDAEIDAALQQPIPPKLPKLNQARHGSLTCYQRGCRCEDCAAMADDPSFQRVTGWTKGRGRARERATA